MLTRRCAPRRLGEPLLDQLPDGLGPGDLAALGPGVELGDEIDWNADPAQRIP